MNASNVTWIASMYRALYDEGTVIEGLLTGILMLLFIIAIILLLHAHRHWDD